MNTTENSELLKLEEKLELWELLVPTQRNDGRPIRTRFHRVWDKKVREVAGGLTVLTPVRGHWVDSPTEEIYTERMIPVRIRCTRKQLNKILPMTLEYYEQKAIFCYKISTECLVYTGNNEIHNT